MTVIKFSYTNEDGKTRSYEMAPTAQMDPSEKRSLIKDGYLTVSRSQSTRFDEMTDSEFEDDFAYELAAAASVGIQEPFLVKFFEEIG